jgi:hypothetical protein
MAATVVLVSGDWQTRALLRAQLLEEGCSVHAFESLGDAAPAFAGLARPLLVIAELSGDELPAELTQLSALAVGRPVWVLAKHSEVDEATLRGRGFEAAFFRPVHIGTW